MNSVSLIDRVSGVDNLNQDNDLREKPDHGLFHSQNKDKVELTTKGDDDQGESERYNMTPTHLSPGHSCSTEWDFQETTNGNFVCELNRSLGSLDHVCAFYLKCDFRFVSVDDINDDQKRFFSLDPLLFYKLIESIELVIDVNQVIAKLDGYQIYMLTKMGKGSGVMNLIELPLPFRNRGQDLPLSSIRYQWIKLRLTTRNHLLPSPLIKIVPRLMLTHHYSREAPAATEKQIHRHLISQFYPTLTMKSENDDGTFKIDCKQFCYRTAALFFTLHLDDSVESMFSPVDELIEYRLFVNGNVWKKGYRRVAGLVNKYQSNVELENYVYVISFAFEALNTNQPTGCVDFSSPSFETAFLEVETTHRVKVVQFWGHYWRESLVLNGIFCFRDDVFVNSKKKRVAGDELKSS